MQQQSLHNTEGTKRERHPDLFASLLQFDNPQDGEYVYTYIYIYKNYDHNIYISQKNLATRNNTQIHIFTLYLHILCTYVVLVPVFSTALP